MSTRITVISLAIALTILTVAPAMARSKATVEVRAPGSVTVAKMAEKSRIHTNRVYYFQNVPKELLGLRFTCQGHKATVPLSCTVKGSGVVYICVPVSHRATPRSLKLPGTWQTVADMQGVEASRMTTWRVWKATLAGGQKFTIPTLDKWGITVAAGRITGIRTAKSARPARPVAPANPADAIATEFNVISKQLGERGRKDRYYPVIPEQTFRRDALALAADRDPTDVVFRRTAALLADLLGMAKAPDLTTEAAELAKLKAEVAATPVADAPARRKLFDTVCKLRRKISFANPLLAFDRIVFLKHHRSKYQHMCDQYFGFHANRGGGVYVLEDAFSAKPTVRDALAGATVVNGRLKGKSLEGGSFISLELSYDAKTILFAWTEAAPTAYKWSPESTFHIFKANIEPGKPVNLTQLTDGPVNDFDPCFMPDGRIVFISERRGGFGRCHGRPVPTYTLHSMKDDGTDIITISYHETNEWHPSVDNSGMLIYSRWDYVDRDSDIAHHLWICYPDGRDPRSYHGNYPVRREDRPWMELANRAIPGSHRYIGVSAPHHGQNYGSLIMIDHRIEDDNAMSQVRRITPEVQLPESQGSNKVSQVYGQPWPLSENYYLSVYDPGCRNYGVYLVDSFGNRELLHRDPSIACLDPIPLTARPTPPVIPSATRQTAEARKTDGDDAATISVMNIYDSEVPWPKNTKITAMRIVQVFPKSTPRVGHPDIGAAPQSLARGVLGTVPVEADGSVHFEAPIGAPLYFQALDAKGQAVQTMRSDTYVHPGEKLVCQGCHEPKRQMMKNPRGKMPIAIRRKPSRITPDVVGSNPLTFPRLVQPVLDRKCVGCHKKQAKAPDLTGTPSGRKGWSKSFIKLSPMGWSKAGGNGAIRRNGGCRSFPGKIGAKASNLLAMLDKGHHNVKLTPEELYRITLWIDCNTVFYGAYFDLEKQARGEVVLPKLK